ncbi:MAG: hypothetical protein GX409_08005 [candidate division Zixibacteria bacterium]|nr:hypothetical protein [candidate division Zixibacteria bacterium]
MDPATLIGPSSQLGYPAAYWFLVLFKVIGFLLHMIPMNIWFAGILVAVLLRWKASDHGLTLSNRLMKQMPIVIALGINFGIVPLLFVQVAYYKTFYPATILMAWFWLAIIALLTVAYYGVYYYAVGIKKDPNNLRRSQIAAGWISSFLFILIGFIFSNGFSLMANISAWPQIWQSTSVAGAPLGIALNTGDTGLWPRYLIMFGIALMTTAAYIVFDSAFFARKESADYRRWAPGFAFKIYTIGMIWFALTGSWYVFGTWSTQVRTAMFASPMVMLTGLTAVIPGVVWLAILLKLRGEVSRSWAIVIGLLQFVLVALNAVSRQMVQNIEIGVYYDVAAERVNTQWSPMILFLLLFVGAVGVIIWLLRKAVLEARQARA